MAADAEEPPTRILRAVYQRRSQEEQALRREAISEIARRASAPREDRQYSPIEGAETPPHGHSKSSAESEEAAPVEGQLQEEVPVSAAGARRCLEDGPLRFSSAFEGGNLLTAKLVCLVSGKGTSGGGSSSSTALAAGGGHETPWNSAEELEYELFIDGDTQSSAGHTQWFYFSVITPLGFRGNVRFRIANMRKKRSLYQTGLQPHVFSTRRNTGWEPFDCADVSYDLNSHIQRPKGLSEGIRNDQSSLAFSYNFQHDDDEVYFASYEPYTYTMLNRFLARLQKHPEAKRHFRCLELCRSIGQLPVPLLVISEGVGVRSRGEASSAAAGEEEDEHGSDARNGSTGSMERHRHGPAKPALGIIARQHPGEVVGSWAMQGVLKFLLGPSPAARVLRSAYVIHIVPMVNVDGVVHGNSRCTLAGVDPNRVWHDPNPIINPVIYALKNHLRNLTQGITSHGSLSAGLPSKGLDMFLDLHGHSAKFGCFFYGCSPTAPVSNALFPKLCAVASPDILFESCHWRCSKTHRKTARYVINKQLGVKFSYTLECSFLAAKPITSAQAALDDVFSPTRVEWMGIAVGRTVTSFLNLRATNACVEDEEHSTSSRPAPDTACLCSELDFLPDITCPTVLAKVPWVTLPALDSTTAAEVLEELVSMYGDQVPSANNPHLDAGSDASGDSDGDGLEEQPAADQVEEGQRRGSMAKDTAHGARASGSVPVRAKRGLGRIREDQRTGGADAGSSRIATGRHGSAATSTSSASPPLPSSMKADKTPASVPVRGASCRARGHNAAMASRRAASVELRGNDGQPAASPSSTVGGGDAADRSAPSSIHVRQRSAIPSTFTSSSLDSMEPPLGSELRTLFVWTDDWTRAPGATAAELASQGRAVVQVPTTQATQAHPGIGESPPSSGGSVGHQKLAPLEPLATASGTQRRGGGTTNVTSTAPQGRGGATGSSSVIFPTAVTRQRGASPVPQKSQPTSAASSGSSMGSTPSGPCGRRNSLRASRDTANTGQPQLGIQSTGVGKDSAARGMPPADVGLTVSPPSVGHRSHRPRQDGRTNGGGGGGVTDRTERQTRSMPPPPAPGGQVPPPAPVLRERSPPLGSGGSVANAALVGGDVVLAVGPGFSRSLPLSGGSAAHDSHAAHVSERTRAVVRSLAWMRKPVAGVARS
mmetsp:Transcript_32416/g.71972  ORF Transcript_32416/g.71972 Transcript_32416/m.71972 type:complete len:1166 (+) Transcript_32416:95-3592(+)